MVGRIVRQVQQAQLLQEADAAAGGILAVHGAAEEGDSPVAEGVQMPHGQAGAVDQVALDADALQGDVRRADRGDGHIPAKLFQGGIQVVAVGGPDAPGEQDAVHAAPDQLIDQLRGDGLVFHGLEEPEAAAVLLRLPVGGVQNPVEIQIGDHGKHHGERSAPAALQVLGGEAGRIGVGVDDLLDLQAGGLLHMGVPADHPRDRGGGYARLTGDIIDGGFSVHALILRQHISMKRTEKQEKCYR